MAAVLVLDNIEDAQIETRGLMVRVIRTGYLTGMASASTDPDPAVMYAAIGIVIAQAGAAYPGNPLLPADDPANTSIPLAGVVLKPFSNDAFFVRIFYETIGGLQPSAYIIRDRAYTATHQTNLVPGTNELIQCSWEGAAVGSDAAPTVPADSITMTFNLPVRGFSVSGLVYGTSTGANQNYVGYVNDDPWPTDGRRVGAQRDAGWWQLVEYSEDESVYSGYYSYSGTAISRSWRDWSESGILRNSLTGRYVKVDQADIDAQELLDYKHGMINTVVNKGIVRVGPYPMTDFKAIFGF
jgi:hypothetical protein